ncbi:MAG: hypothetical protein AVDCRST_MAG89-3015, partial [uncultured Gemmatimonadetes bacterium]
AYDAAHGDPPGVQNHRRSLRPVRRERRSGDGAPRLAPEPVAGEPVRLRGRLAAAGGACAPGGGGPARLRPVRAPRRADAASRDGRFRAAHRRRVRAGAAARGGAGRGHGRLALRRRAPPGALPQPGGGERRRGVPAAAGRGADGVDRGARPRAVPPHGRTRHHHHRHGHAGAVHALGRRARGLPGLLRRRPVRGIDGVRARLSHRRARPRHAAAVHPDPGAGHRRAARRRGAAGERGVLPRAPPREPPGLRGLRPLHLGGRGGRVRDARCRLVGRRLRGHL